MLVCLPQPTIWLGIYRYKKQSKMTEQEEKKDSVDYLLDIIANLLGDKSTYDSIKFNQICLNANSKHENELKEAYNKGYSKGYTDHANLINMLNK
jgi:hypothetical protein